MLNFICMGPVTCQERVEIDKIQKENSCPQLDLPTHMQIPDQIESLVVFAC